jgi:hypothetical protein
MSIWDKKVAPVARRSIENLNQSQRLRLALRCIDDVRGEFDKALRPLVSAKASQSFELAFQMLWGAKDASDIPQALAASLVHDSLWLANAPPGVWDMAMSLLFLLRRAGSTFTVDDIVESMSAAYQVVLQIEVLRKLDLSTEELELEKREQASPACMICIERQFNHLGGTGNGEGDGSHFASW